MHTPPFNLSNSQYNSKPHPLRYAATAGAICLLEAVRKHYRVLMFTALIFLIQNGKVVHAQTLSILGDSLSGVTSRIWDHSWAVGGMPSSTLQVAGGTGPYAWALTGNVPPGLAIRSLNFRTGSTSGRLTSAGIYSFAITVTDQGTGASLTIGPYDLVVGPALQFSAAHSFSATAGLPFSAAVLVVGGNPSQDCIVAMEGLHCAVSGNLLTVAGTVTATRTTSYQTYFQIIVPTDNGPAYNTAVMSINMPLKITGNTDVVANGLGHNYGSGSSVRGTGTGPFTSRISDGRLPPGTELVWESGDILEVRGKLLAAGTFTYTITAVDRWGSTASQTFRVVVPGYPPLRVSSPPPPNGTVGRLYIHQIIVDGPTPLQWSINGTLPEGLDFSRVTRELIGVPRTAGTTRFTFSITDSATPPRTVQYSVTVSISPATALVQTRSGSLPIAYPGVPYSVQATAAGGVPPYAWRSENMPAGVTVSQSGLVTAMPSVTGRYTFRLTVSDSANSAVYRDFSLVVMAPVPLRALPAGTAGVLYGSNYGVFLPMADGSTNTQSSVSWFLSSGELPPGIVLNANGSLYGIPRMSGTFTFVAQRGDLDSGGYLLSYSVSINPSPGVFSYSLSDQESTLLSTPGTNPVLRTAHGLLVPDAQTATPAGAAFFEFRQNGVLISETTVPASTPLEGGRIFVELSPTVKTGIAFSNTRSSSATVNLSFIDMSGITVLGRQIRLAPNSQIAAFLDQPPFDGPAEFTGTVRFSTVTSVSVLALRGLTNERSEFLLTTLPVTPEVPQSGEAVIPQFAAGGGWTTQLVLMNPTRIFLRGTVEFLDSGSLVSPPKAVSLSVNGNTATSFQYEIPPYGVQKLIATGSDNLQVGSVRIRPAATNFTPYGMLTYSFRSGDVTLSETGLGIGEVAESHRLFVENAINPRIQTGIAIANTLTDTVAVELKLVDLTGAEVGRSVVTLPGNGQIAKYVHEIPELRIPPNFRGLLLVSAPTKAVVVSGSRGRYNERGDYFETTVAPVDSSASAGVTAKTFPHLVDGGGYKTNIVIFSGTSEQVGSGFLRILDPSGVPSDLF